MATKAKGVCAVWLLLVACQSTATPGATCAANRDCGSPLVCRLGRCRNECVANRDCPQPARCLLDANHFGACSLDADERCVSGGHACAASLLCVGDTCASTCVSDADCPSDGVCRDAGTTGVRFCFAPDRQDAGPSVDASPLDASADAPLQPPDAGGFDGGFDVGIDAPADAGPDAGPCVGSACGTASAICATRNGTCVLQAGRVYCWGDERILGDQFETGGSPHACATGLGCSARPVVVHIHGSGAELTDAREIACGASAVCVIAGTTTREVYCWGDDDHGQLGGGTGPGAVLIPNTTSAQSLVAGVDTFCAVTNAGQAVCWGNSHDGQLGVVTDRFAPAVVPSAQQPIGLGQTHSCYANGGTMACRGADDHLQLGPGGTGVGGPTPNTFSTIVSGPATAADDLYATQFGTCGNFGSQVWCWGFGACGQLGSGVSGGSRALTRVGSRTYRVTWASAFSGVVCAQTLGASPQTDCWGRFEPASGCATTDEPSVPMHRLELDTALFFAAGARHRCMIDTLGVVLCSGNDAYGQLGRGTASSADFADFQPVCINATCVP